MWKFFFHFEGLSTVAVDQREEGENEEHPECEHVQSLLLL